MIENLRDYLRSKCKQHNPMSAFPGKLCLVKFRRVGTFIGSRLDAHYLCIQYPCYGYSLIMDRKCWHRNVWKIHLGDVTVDEQKASVV